MEYNKTQLSRLQNKLAKLKQRRTKLVKDLLEDTRQ